MPANEFSPMVIFHPVCDPIDGFTIHQENHWSRFQTDQDSRNVWIGWVRESENRHMIIPQTIVWLIDGLTNN